MLAVRPEDALRFVAARQGGILTAMLRHRDDAVAVGDEDLADPAALQGMPAESPPAGGVVILYGDRQDGRAPRGAGDRYDGGADGGAAWR